MASLPGSTLLGNVACRRNTGFGLRIGRECFVSRIAPGTPRHKSSHQPKRARNSAKSSASQAQPIQVPRPGQLRSQYLENRPVEYTGPQSRKLTPTRRPLLLYELRTSKGLTWTTWGATVFFGGTSVLTAHDYSAIASTQPIIYAIGMGLSAIWVGVAGYCFFAPLKLIRTITLLPSRNTSDPNGVDERLEVTFQQVLPLIKYKPITVEAEEVGTNHAVAEMREKLEHDMGTATSGGPIKAYYRHFVKMFSRNTMAYVQIGDKGIWKLDLDPNTSGLPSTAKTLNRIVRPRHFPAWYNLWR